MSGLSLLEAVRALAQERADKVALDEKVRALRTAFDEEHQAVLFAQRLASDTIAKRETTVRQLALETYLNTEEKKPAPGIEIKQYKTMSVLDKPAALVWAKQTGMALIPECLDEKALFKIAAATPLPFVLYTEEPRVTIATQLPAAELLEVTS